MKRDLLNEIASIKSRTEYDSRHDFSARLDQIEYAFKENLSYNGDYNTELLKYIPIATVACFEAFFRSVYKELIDFGKPFSDNVSNFNQAKNIKFDFEIVNAIQTKTVTTGEFISHVLPCNNFKDINSNMSILIGTDFIKELKIFEKESVFQEIKVTSDDFKNKSHKLISSIQKVFELRHIFCHEFATNTNIDKEEMFECFNHSKLFLNQTNNFIWELLYPGSPETQTDMNIQSHKEFEQVDQELSGLISLIKETGKQAYSLGINEDLFDNSIKEWKKYRASKAKLDASIAEGGTLYPLLYTSSLKGTTQEKIESLKKRYEVDLRKYASI
ncbi:lysozyme inhibitor LprI family protein [Salegentibacter sp. F188]|uniref:Lysozyme inhibitor LprI family protein n=1 Tax=Autumnicola patrickiae TaxID=3075591 RepID=A0ABU3DZX4_9FLAO|nr:lysozyme inhibitor LprI family protein [Salegentibacter sp. F188]MDT0689250.1 lysozyme inhibitor LprI family protein [Salegentibacter sp. F188]